MIDLYAYRNKATGELRLHGAMPYSAKAPATSDLYTHLWRTTGVLEDWPGGGRRWKRLPKADIKQIALKEWALVSFEIIPTADLEALREDAAKYRDLASS